MSRGSRLRHLAVMTVLSQLSSTLSALVAATSPSILVLRGARFDALATAWTSELAVTVAHALGRRDQGKVLLADGSEADATVVARDPGTDVAVLRVTASLSVPCWSDTQPEVGALVLAVARDGAGRPRAILGPVQGRSGAWRTRSGAVIDALIEVDAALPWGASGGPLVSASGEVIGLNTHRLRRAGATVPTVTVRRVVESLLAHGEARRGRLGIAVAPATLAPVAAGRVGRTHALLVTSVAPDGPAMRAGLLLGDVLTAVDEQAVEHLEDLLGALSTRGGRRGALQLLRGGEPLTLEVEVETR
jgi:S1-C subfamily serine protease